MKTDTFKGNVLEIEDNIEELTADRHNDFARYVAMDSAIGSDLAAFDQHCFKIMRLCKTDPDMAIRQISNMQQSVHFVLGRIHPEQKSFVTLLHSINGRVLTDEDRTDEGMEQIIKELSTKGLTIGRLRNLLAYVKKNFETQFETMLSFPESAVTKMVYTSIQKKYILLLQKIQGKAKDFTDQVAKIDEEIDTFLKPVVFTGRDGHEVRMIKDFDDACALLSNFGVSSRPEKMSTFSFYNRLDWVRKQVKARQPKKV